MRKITNRRKILAAIFVALLSFFLTNCAVREPSKSEKPITRIQSADRWQTLQVDQKKRWYLLYVPTIYDAGTPVPLVLNFHGSRSNPDAQLA
ncbi:MAG: hypothetical protein JRE14_09930 [Deltaproteobacteria bacterium]|nr:hypothetical protein [Deltaproteobacteria bacterium]